MPVSLVRISTRSQINAFKIEWLGACAVIAMPAEIDVTNSNQARQALIAAASQGPGVLIIEMSETTFCDSTGVEAMVAAYRQAAAIGTQLQRWPLRSSGY